MNGRPWGTSPNNQNKIDLYSFRLKSIGERSVLIADLQKCGEFRCVHCGQMFFMGKLSPGTNIQVKCTKCKCMNVIENMIV